MATLNSLKELSALNTQEYKGNFPKYQQEGNKLNGKKFVHYEQDHFSFYQNMLYKRAIFGLSAYTDKELKGMHRQKKTRIEKVHKKAQLSLNLMKQEKVNRFTNTIFKVWFPDCNITKSLEAMVGDTDPNFLNTMDLKSLGISKSSIVTRFVSEGILPKNFYQKKQLNEG